MFLIVALFFILVSACSKNGANPSMEDQQLQKLLGTWKPGVVLVDGTDITDQYTDFYLTFIKDGDEKKLTATNPGFAFTAGLDSWSFVTGSQASKIVRSADGIEMDVNVDQNTLTLSFTIPEASTGGRISGLSGSFTFRLLKE